MGKSKRIKISVAKTRQKCIIHKFSNGKLKQKAGDNLKVHLLSRTGTTNPRLKQQRMLVAETPKMTYVGKNFGIHAQASKGMCRFHIGVLDPETKEMKVYDMEMFSMQPEILKNDVEDLTNNNPEEKEEKSFREKNDMLISAFGSAKSKRAMESRNKTTLRTEDLMTAMNSSLDLGLAQLRMQPNTPEVSSTDGGQSSLPPCNHDATDVVDVYNINDILSEDDLEILTPSAKILFDATADEISTWRTTKKYAMYVLSHVSILPLEETSRWFQCKLLSYINYLMIMHRMTAKDLKKKNPLPDDWPLQLKNKLLDSFTTQVLMGKRSMRCFPLRLKDKIVSQVLVLTLFLDEFCVNVKDLPVDLKMAQDRILRYYGLLGCRTKKSKLADKSTKAEAILKLPLFIPSDTRKGKRN